MILYATCGKFGEQCLHRRIESVVVGGSTKNKTFVLEYVAQDVGVVGARHVVHNDVLHTGNACSACYNLGTLFCIAVHRTVADDKSRFCLIETHAVVFGYNAADVLVPYGSVGRANVVDLHSGELLKSLLNGYAIFANDVGIVALHL